MDIPVVFGILAVFILVSLAIAIVICLILSKCFKRIPQQFREMEPGMVWLLLIPCFSIVWNFFVFPRLAKSYKAYFASVNRTDVGDCGEQMGWAYAICGACSIIPYLGIVAGLVALLALQPFLFRRVPSWEAFWKRLWRHPAVPVFLVTALWIYGIARTGFYTSHAER